MNVMLQTLNTSISKPIRSVVIVNGTGKSPDTPVESEHQQKIKALEEEKQQELQELQKKKTELSQLCENMTRISEQFEHLYENCFSEYKEKIAELAIRISEKILMKKIEEKDYNLTKIITEAVRKSPDQQKIRLMLNPSDHQRASEDQQIKSISTLELIADQNIGPAEYRLETPRGILESNLNDNLVRIEDALKKAV